MKNKIKLTGIPAIVLVFVITMAGCGAFTDTHKISNYLSLAKEVGRSAEGPVPLAVKINMNDDWDNLLSTINSAGVRVNLNLSGCTMTNTEFNPGKKGSDYIVSLVLPDAVTKIEGDFNVFKNLTDISFPASVEIDETNPFVGCSSITFSLKGRGDLSVIENSKALVRSGNELVAYPSATGSITLNNISVIGRSAFNGTSIEEINLPSVTTIGVRAFSGCENLQTLNIPAVKDISENAFANTGDTPLVITFRTTLETIAANLFEGVNKRKNVTLKVPQSEVENFTAMRDAFRGRGWSEEAFVVAAGYNRTVYDTDYWGYRKERTVWVNSLNNYINITIEEY